MKQALGDVKTSQLFYRFYGDVANPCIVIETALASCSAEWWHLAEKWSEHYGVLVYDRSGLGA